MDRETAAALMEPGFEEELDIGKELTDEERATCARLSWDTRWADMAARVFAGMQPGSHPTRVSWGLPACTQLARVYVHDRLDMLEGTTANNLVLETQKPGSSNGRILVFAQDYGFTVGQLARLFDEGADIKRIVGIALAKMARLQPPTHTQD